MPRSRSASSSVRIARRPAGSSALRGLVEQQQLGLADECLRDSKPLLHPLGHPLDAPARDVAQADELEQLVALALAALGSRESLVKREDLRRGGPAREPEQLGEVTELPARLSTSGRTSHRW